MIKKIRKTPNHQVIKWAKQAISHPVINKISKTINNLMLNKIRRTLVVTILKLNLSFIQEELRSPSGLFIGAAIKINKLMVQWRECLNNNLRRLKTKIKGWVW